MKRLRLLAVAGGATLALALSLPAAPGGPSVNLSGYEFLLGISCGTNQTCGVQFGGWTQNNNLTDWATFPGNGKGLWKATVNYSGSPAFGDSVDVLSGKFDVLFKNGKRVSGTVNPGGTVTWPEEGTTGCGGVTNAATISLTLALENGRTGYFSGCLHDLPAGTVIPPKEWGTLYY